MRNLTVGIDVDLNRLTPGINSAVRQFDQLGRAGESAGNRLVSGFDKPRDAMGRFVSTGQSAGSSLSNAFNSPLASLGKFASGLFAVDKAIDLVKQGLTIVSNFQRMDAALRAVSTSSADFSHTQIFLRAVSDQYGVSLEGLSKAYAGFKANTNDTILKGAEAERIFLSITKASAALQLSTEDTTGTLRAFGQMLSKGTVQSEELKGQVGERLYNAFGLAAKAMGVTTVELNKMLASGEIMATDLLPKLATEVDRTFGANAINNIQTMSGSWSRATDQLSLFVQGFAETRGIDTFLSKLNNGIADYIASLGEAQRRGESMFQMGDRRAELGVQVKLRQQAATSTPEERQKMLEEQAKLLQETQYKVDNPKQFGLNQAVLDANKRLVGYLKERIQIIRREGRRINEAEADAAKPSSAEVDPAELYKKKQDQFSKLRDKKAGLATEGKTLTGKDADDYNRLEKELARATEATKKYKEATQKPNVKPASLQDELKRLESLQSDNAAYGIMLPNGTLHEIDKLRVNIKDMKGEYEKPLKPSGLNAISVNIQSEAERAAGFINALKDKAKDVVNFLPDQIDKLQASIRNSALDFKPVSSETIGKLATYLSILEKVNRAEENAMSLAKGIATANEVKSNKGTDSWASGAGVAAAWGDEAYKQLGVNSERVIKSAKDMAKNLQSVLQQGAQGAAEGMGNLIAGLINGTAGIEDLPVIILGVVADMLQSLAQALAASAAVMLFVPGLQGQAIAQLAGATGLFAVAALARGLAQPKAKGFAEGGGASGSIFANIGEGRGTTRNNPELILPLDRSVGMLANKLGKTDLFSQGRASQTSGQLTPYSGPNGGMLGRIDVGGVLTADGRQLKTVLTRVDKSDQVFGNGK